ncbi:hypothetical protein ABNQ38_33560 [Azospirillum sp. A29]|uniref:hypothetical protein n=1 Tax=Azospirillum sp. A29 TaxID=3160606 RepID=UPI0036715CFE
MTDSRDATLMPNRRTVLTAAVLPLIPAPSTAQETRSDQAIAELRGQSSAAQARAEVRRLALEVAGAADGAEQGDPEWLHEIAASDGADTAVSDHIHTLERTPAVGLAGAIAKLEFAVADGFGKSVPLARSALDDLRRMATGGYPWK